jgi:hypothetical protein
MNLEYKHDLDTGTAKQRIDEYVDKLDNMQFSGGFAIDDMKKSWTGDEMQLSMNLKKMVIDRRIKGNFRFKEKLLIMDVEIPSVVLNLISEKNLEQIIRRNLDTIFMK